MLPCQIQGEAAAEVGEGKEAVPCPVASHLRVPLSWVLEAISTRGNGTDGGI